VDLEDVFGEIETDSGDMLWNSSLSGAEAITLSHKALPGAGAVHSIIYGTGPNARKLHGIPKWITRSHLLPDQGKAPPVRADQCKSV
jgi:hypothetical protein